MVALGPHGSEEEKLADGAEMVVRDIFWWNCARCLGHGRVREGKGKRRVDRCIAKSQCFLNKLYFVAVK